MGNLKYACKKKCKLVKITDFYKSPSSSSSTEEDRAGLVRVLSTEVSSEDSTIQAQRTRLSKHKSTSDPKWEDELPWLHYLLDHKDGPSMFCSLSQKHNETTKRMVWISIPCKQLCKDKLHTKCMRFNFRGTKINNACPQTPLDASLLYEHPV